MTAARPVAGLASNGKPPYPRAAQRRGEQGKVMLLVRVSASGDPVSVTVADSSGSASLDAAARDKVLQDWRFVPATRDGVPIPGEAVVPMNFVLEDPGQ